MAATKLPGVSTCCAEQSMLDNDFESVGRFDFAGRYSGDNMVDFLYGKPSAFTQVVPNYGNFRRDLYGGYIQDNYKVSRRLTLNLGLRWNPFVPFTDMPNALATQFDQNAYRSGIRSNRYPNLPAGMLVGGDPGIPRSVVNSSFAVFDPRLGSRSILSATERRASAEVTAASTTRQRTDLQPAGILASSGCASRHRCSIQLRRSVQRVRESLPGVATDSILADLSDTFSACGDGSGFHISQYSPMEFHGGAKPARLHGDSRELPGCRQAGDCSRPRIRMRQCTAPAPTERIQTSAGLGRSSRN